MRRVAEVGCGTGAMGMAIAMAMPEVEVLLIDRRQKAVGFCEIIVWRLELPNVKVIQADLEQDSSPVGRVDAALFRAVSPVPEDLEMAEEIVRRGGLALIWTRFDQPLVEKDGWIAEERQFTKVAGLVLHIYRRAEKGADAADRRE